MLGSGISKERLAVKIVDAEHPLGNAVAIVGTMPYEEATRFLAAFNDGKITFEGRVR